MGNHCFKSTCKPKLAKSITLNKNSKKIIASNLKNCYFKREIKKIVTLNHLVSQHWKTVLL